MAALRGHVGRLWRFLIGTWPGRIAAIVGFVPAAWGAWQILEPLLVDAHVSGQLECHPSLLVLHVQNSGGRSAQLGDATFQMKSFQRWEDRNWHDRSFSARANPIDRDRDLSAHEPQRYEYKGSSIFEAEEIGGADCQFRVTLPYTSDGRRRFAEIRECTCER